MAQFKIDEKFERRKQEIVDVEDIIKDLESDAAEVKAKIQKEVTQNQTSKFFAAYL